MAKNNPFIILCIIAICVFHVGLQTIPMFQFQSCPSINNAEAIPQTISSSTNNTANQRQRQQQQTLINELRQIAIEQQVPISRIYLLGERNSGTNYMIRNALKNAYIQYAGKDKQYESFRKDIPVLGDKHMHLHHLLNETQLRQFVERSTDALYILQVRDPCTWDISMKKQPWHLCPPYETPNRCDDPNAIPIFLQRNTTADMTLTEFFKMPWRDWRELEGTNWSQPLLSGYDNIFCLRTHKLKLMQQVRDVLPHRTRLVHFRDLESSPDRILQELREEFGLLMNSRYKPERPSQRQHRTPCLTPEERELAIAAIDWAVEAQFGFLPDDCRVCAAADAEQEE